MNIDTNASHYSMHAHGWRWRNLSYFTSRNNNHWGLKCHVATQLLVNIYSSYDLLPGGTKLSPEPMLLTYHQKDPVTITPTLYMVLPLFATRFAAYPGGMRVSHTATSLLIWYKMFCTRDISYRLTWMKFINMLSLYTQSGTHRRVNWWITTVLT